MNEIKQPMFIIGAARSGTKMIGNVFNIHKDVSYIGESNYIWRIGNVSHPNDALSINNLNEDKKSLIVK